MKLDSDLIGFLNIDKPEDWTSHDVVAKVRRILKTRRIGHAGTLDPFATGVLPLAVGPATRLLRFLRKSKKYLAEIDMRTLTDTDDLTGEIIKENPVVYSKEEFTKELKKQCGTFEQIPPLYSAKKVNGKKLYELMREGVDLDLSDIKAKEITIHEIKLISFDYPFAQFEVSCGEGTYIRSIARDLGGHLTKLRRLESNGFGIETSFSFEDLNDEDLDINDLLLNPVDFLGLDKMNFSRKEVQALQLGQRVYLDQSRACLLKSEINDKNESYLTCLNESEELIGLAAISIKDGDYQLQPKVIL